MRHKIKLFGILLVTLLAYSQSFARRPQPNIIFILADDWGRGDIKAYGGDLCKIDTPNMDQLARKGMKFMDAHTTSSVCTPSRYGVLTGRYDFRSNRKSGVNGGFSTHLIVPGRETVASFLKKNGYTTACIGKWHLGMDFATNNGKPAKSNIKKKTDSLDLCNVDWNKPIKNGPTTVGFDYYWGISASLDMAPYIWIHNDRFVGECTKIKAFHRWGPAEANFEDYKVLPTLTEKAVKFITKESSTQNPFFLYLPLNSPHTPIAPTKAFKGKSKLGTYGDFVMETDWAIGEVIKTVEKAGIANNTLIIVTADNGCSPAARTHGNKKNIKFWKGKEGPIDPDAHYPSVRFRGHKADIYEGGHRVPFIVRWDGIVKPNTTSESTICLADFFATCADILGKKYPDTAAEDSVSMLPILLGKSDKTQHEAIVHHSINGSFSIRQGHWKLAFCPGSGGWSSPGPGSFKKKKVENWVQLFNLASDPAETKNVAKQNPEVVDRLTKLAQKYIDDGRSTPGKSQENNGATYLYPSWIRRANPGK